MGFNWIAISFQWILKTSRNTKSITRSEKDRVKNDCDSREKYSSRVELNDKDEVGGIKVDSIEIKNNQDKKEKNY